MNTLFMTTMFLGGALGSSMAATAWHHGGWAAVCMLGGALPLVALLLNVVRRRLARPQQAH